jgi:RNA polymerase-binding transcription factor DksA
MTPADAVAPTPDEGRSPTVDAANDETVDLDRIERDLAGVDAALGRLDDGTYWTDEVTGEPIPDEVLASDPVARTVR